MGVPVRALVCVDFDGTLVDPEGDPPFPVELGELLEALRGEGTQWVIATGRSLYQAVSGITSYRIGTAPDYLITSEREIHRRTALNRWVDVGKWNARCAKDHRRLFRGNSRFFRQVKAHLADSTGARYVESDGEPAAIIATSENEMDGICAYLDSVLPKIPPMGYERNSVYLRFSHGRYSKGAALAELASQLGVDRGRVFAAGDNYNDLSMVDGSRAAMTACPSNAVPRVKAAVAGAGGFVSPRRAGHGVLDALRHYFGPAPGEPPGPSGR